MPRAPFAGAAISACIPGLPSNRATPTSSRFTRSTAGDCGARATPSAVDHRPPDSRWFGNRPDLIAERRGEGVDELITRIEQAVETLPLRGYVSRLARPELEHVRRARAARRTGVARRSCRRRRSARTTSARRSSRGRRAARAHSSTCSACSALSAGVEEGVELNVLGLTFGVDPLDLVVEAAVGGPRSVGREPVPAAPAAAAEET